MVLNKIEFSKASITYSNEFTLDKADWEDIYVLPRKLKMSNKVKEINYKILHNYVATNKLLYKIGINDSPRCNFCNLYEQNTKHLFFECLSIRNFWFAI